MVDDFDTLMDLNGYPDTALRADLIEMITLADAEKPRSLQKVPGPSELGHPCARQLAFKLLSARTEHPENRGYNQSSGRMNAITGTALHDWLERAAHMSNERLGRVRWVPEQRVMIRAADDDDYRPEIAGTCDLYDFDTKTVIDFKSVGATVHSERVKDGPTTQQIAQVNLYASGFVKMGFEVEHVALLYIVPIGTFRQIHLCRQPYDPSIVEKTLSRLDDIENKLRSLEPILIDATPGKHCMYCSWFSVNPTGLYQCGGENQ